MQRHDETFFYQLHSYFDRNIEEINKRANMDVCFIVVGIGYNAFRRKHRQNRIGITRLPI